MEHVIGFRIQTHRDPYSRIPKIRIGFGSRAGSSQKTRRTGHPLCW